MSHRGATPGASAHRVWRLRDGEGGWHDDRLIEEVPVALLYNDHSHAVMMATPIDLDDFAVGFSLSEGVVAQYDELRLIQQQASEQGVLLHLQIPQRRFDALAARQRNLVGRSGCGLCGLSDLDALVRPLRPAAAAGAAIALDQLRAGFAQLERQQTLNQMTGAVHAAAAWLDDGRLLVREDVGRHNAVDKALGAAARCGGRIRLLLVTSRASYEIVHKAAALGCPAVATLSGATAMAVAQARQLGLSLAGFVRSSGLTVYCGEGFGR